MFVIFMLKSGKDVDFVGSWREGYFLPVVPNPPLSEFSRCSTAVILRLGW
jgi:hypothetical protein